MIQTTAETWRSALSKRKQNHLKDELARELGRRGMDIPDSE